MASFATEDLIINKAFTITLWTGEDDTDYIEPDWIFPVTSSSSKQNFAALPAREDAQFPDFTLARLTVGDCIGIAALLEGFPGLSREKESTAPIPSYCPVWVRKAVQPSYGSRDVLKTSDLRKKLSDLDTPEGSGVWLVAAKGWEKKDKVHAVLSLMARHQQNPHQREKNEDNKRRAAFAQQILKRTPHCSITQAQDSLEVAHIVPLAMGSRLLSLISLQWNKLRSEVMKAVNNGSIVLEDDIVFADARLAFPSPLSPDCINNEYNGWVLTSDLHDSQDRGHMWCYNPVSKLLLWLDNATANNHRAKTSFGFLADRKLKPALIEDDPRHSLIANEDGIPLAEQPTLSFMLHCTNMLLVTSHRFLTRQKAEKIIEISTKIATALKQGQDGNGASGSSAGPGSSGSGSGTDRPRGGGGSGGPDGSGSGSGAGRGHVGLGGSGSSGSSGGRKRGAAGGSDEMGGGSSAVLGGGSTHVEGHGDGEVESEKGDDEELDIRPRKRARTQQLLTPSTSAESNLSPSGGPIGTFSLKSLLEEIQEPTQRPETGFSDAEGKDEELRSALFEKHPHLKRWETTDNLWDYHTGIVKEGALLLYLIGGLVQNSLSQKIDMSGGDEDGEE